MTKKYPTFRHRAKWLSFALGLVVLGFVLYFYRRNLNQESIVAFSERLPAFWIILAFLLLPLCGIPIRIMLILAGFRFGFAGGMVLSGIGIFFHNYVAYFITRGSFRASVRNFLKRSGYAIPSIPAKHRIWLTAVVAAIPGPPYFAKLYLLALTDLPLRIFVGIGASIYFLLSAVPVGIGGAVVEYEAKWLYLLATAFVLITVIGVWLRKRYAGFVEEDAGSKGDQV